jgi:hypothetical protein
LAGSLIGIKFVSESVYEIRIPFESQASLITYSNNSIAIPLLQPVILLRDIPLGTGFLAFLNWKLQMITGLYKGNEYFVSFSDFNGTVGV